MNILLKDILNFDKLEKEYPDRRIKLRFNTNWEDGEKIINYNEMYRAGRDEFFDNSILSVWGPKRRRISDEDIIFQFIEVSAHKWLLIDAVKIVSTNKGEFAEAETLNEYEVYFGRLFVKFTNLPQKFFYVSRDIINKVEVWEISKEHYLKTEEEFTGYENVCKSYNKLKQIIDNQNWKEALSNVYGVYLLTDTNTGKKYVGSAYGENGIYGRWKTYLEKGYDKNEIENGEYPNKQLEKLVKKEGRKYIEKYFQYSILEIFSKTETGKEKSLQRETYWKKVLRSREFGYNDN